jgi:hypothetical protein
MLDLDEQLWRTHVPRRRVKDVGGDTAGWNLSVDPADTHRYKYLLDLGRPNESALKIRLILTQPCRWEWLVRPVQAVDVDKLGRAEIDYLPGMVPGQNTAV